MGSSNTPDPWLDQAGLYSNQASRLTELHGADLVTLLKDDILQARTILDIGCGTGAFAKAYIQQFPNGVPGQTLILSDLSEGMLDKAKETVVAPPNYGTTFVFQQEDGTKLEGIADDSVDIVVSLFGVFLIPDQEATRHAIQRVLVKSPDSVVAIASWQFGLSESLVKLGFGVSLQDAFELSVTTIDPSKKGNVTTISQWGTKDGASKLLWFDYRLEQVDISSSLHTTVWEFYNFWTMLSMNPMSNIQGAPEEAVQRAKTALIQLITQGGIYPIDKPIMFSTASNLCIGRGLSAGPR